MSDDKGLPLEKLHHTPGKSDICAHVSGTTRGEQRVRKFGREPGRDQAGHRTYRDATSVNPEGRKPIDPKMPNLPPA